MVGEYHYQDIKNSNDPFFIFILWALFINTLIFTQIVFLNTLIAIISDTFERVWDKKSQIILSSKADLLLDWLSIRGLIKIDVNEQFLFVVEPTHQDETSSDNWEGKISNIRKTLIEKINDLQMEYQQFKTDFFEKLQIFGTDL